MPGPEILIFSIVFGTIVGFGAYILYLLHGKN